MENHLKFRVIYCLVAGLSCSGSIQAADKNDNKRLLPANKLIAPVSKPVQNAAIKTKPVTNKHIEPVTSLIPKLPTYSPASALTNRDPVVGRAGQATVQAPSLTPSLPAIPVHRIQPMAPPVLNPRTGGGFVPAPIGRTTGQGQGQGQPKPHFSGAGSSATPDKYGLLLAPLTQPESGSGAKSPSLSHETGAASLLNPYTPANPEQQSTPASPVTTEGSLESARHGGFIPTTDADGNQMFGTGDGTRIPATSPDGQAGEINQDGSVSYGDDGLRVKHDDQTGETLVTHPDGRVVELQRGARGPSKKPTYNSEQDSYVYPDGVSVMGSTHSGQRGKMQANGDIDYPDGMRVSHDLDTGRTTIHKPDGSREIYENDIGTKESRQTGHLHTEPGIDAAPADDGGTDVFDRETSTSAHFGGHTVDGGGQSTAKFNSDTNQFEFGQNADGSHSFVPATDPSGGQGKIGPGGTVQYSDGTEVRHNSTTGDTEITHSDGSVTTQHRGDGQPNDSDSSDNGNDPSARTIVDDRVANMKGEKRNVESPGDFEPGNGGSAPDSVSQPSPDGGHRGSPLARPSAVEHQSPVGNIITPTIKSPSLVGGGDCFQPGGCNNLPIGGFIIDPFDRDPITNPGG